MSHFALLRAQRLEQREAVFVRHHQVAQHRIGLFPLDGSASFPNGRGQGDVHASLGQKHAERDSAVRIVVDDENTQSPRRALI